MLRSRISFSVLLCVLTDSDVWMFIYDLIVAYTVQCNAVLYAELRDHYFWVIYRGIP